VSQAFSVSPDFYTFSRGVNPVEGLISYLSLLSAPRPPTACGLLASLRWPCSAGFPGASTRRCRVRLQRPYKIINSEFYLFNRVLIIGYIDFIIYILFISLYSLFLFYPLKLL
jgi:hypothetical protein